MKKRNKVLVSILVVFILIQLIRVDYENPAVEPSEDFLQIYKTPPEMKSLIQNSCYDCHSNETEYPGYAQVAPISWWIKNHVDEGRKHLNFSEFGKYNAYQKEHSLAEATDQVKKNKMPMGSYTWLHEEAKLSQEEKQQLADYFIKIRTEILSNGN